MRVAEIFISIQGEGRNIGYPTTFIRFVGCNLHCKWCDSGYSDPDTVVPSTNMSPDAIINAVNEKVVDVCITGGEPLLQDPILLREVMLGLKRRGHRISVETNGTLMPSLRYDQLVDLYSVSPKLGSSGMTLNNEKLREFVGLFRHKMQFKFVIACADDLWHLKRVLEHLREWDLEVDTAVVPEGGKLAAVKKLFEDCTLKAGILWGYNIRYLPQLHKELGMR